MHPGSPLSRDVRGGLEPATQSSRSAAVGDLVCRGRFRACWGWRVKGYLKIFEATKASRNRNDQGRLSTSCLLKKKQAAHRVPAIFEPQSPAACAEPCGPGNLETSNHGSKPYSPQSCGINLCLTILHPHQTITGITKPLSIKALELGLQPSSAPNGSQWLPQNGNQYCSRTFLQRPAATQSTVVFPPRESQDHLHRATARSSCCRMRCHQVRQLHRGMPEIKSSACRGSTCPLDQVNPHLRNHLGATVGAPASLRHRLPWLIVTG